MLQRNLMLGRITISLTMAVALMTAPFHVSARSCIVSDTAVNKACQPACCANKTCCATSKKISDPVSQPLAKNGSAPELNATCAVTLNAVAPDCFSLDRQISFSRTRSCAPTSPQLAVLCTFRI